MARRYQVVPGTPEVPGGIGWYLTRSPRYRVGISQSYLRSTRNEIHYLHSFGFWQSFSSNILPFPALSAFSCRIYP